MKLKTEAPIFMMLATLILTLPSCDSPPAAFTTEPYLDNGDDIENGDDQAHPVATGLEERAKTDSRSRVGPIDKQPDSATNDKNSDDREGDPGESLPPPLPDEKQIEIENPIENGDPIKVPSDHPNDHKKDSKPPPENSAQQPETPFPAKVTQIFESTTTKDGFLTFSTESKFVKQEILLQRKVIPGRQHFKQSQRPVFKESFSLSPINEEISEDFIQGSSSKEILDILIVIDNSRSMREEQRNLSTKLFPLLSSVADTEWRIAVTTTDPKDGCFVGVINKDDADYERKFQSAIQAGIEGNGNEQGILQAVNALKAECGKSWLRDRSNLAILIVSDEDNCSDGQKCGNSKWKSANYLLDYLDMIRTVGTTAKVHGLIWHESLSRWQCPTALRRAPIYSELIKQSGGNWGSICAHDYSETLEKISKNLKFDLIRQFKLKHPPLANTASIYVNEELMPSDSYSIVGSTLVFHLAPHLGAEIQIKYEYLSNQEKNKFYLENEADPRTIKVYLNEVPVNHHDYRYDESERMVVMNIPSKKEAERVDISYQRSEDLQKKIELEQNNIIFESINVTIDGIHLAPDLYQVDSFQHLITLLTAPHEGAMIDISYRSKGEPQLEYPMIIPETSLSSLVLYQVDDPSSYLNFQYQDGKIPIVRESFIEHQRVAVRYLDNHPRNHMINIGHILTGDAIYIQVDRSECPMDKIEIIENHIDISQCMTQENHQVEVEFEYIDTHINIFHLGDFGALPRDQYRWQVFINGMETDLYHLSNDVISFQDLDYFSTISIHATKNLN